MCLTDRCQLESASHMAVTKSVKRLNTHIILAFPLASFSMAQRHALFL